MTMKPAILIAGICFFIIVFLSCKEYQRNKTYRHVPLSSIRKGEALAKKYCQSCHVFPDPSLANAHSWEEGILPNMGPRLGIYQFNFRRYPSARNDSNLDSTIYPKQPLLSLEEWKHIIDYYTATAPDSLPPQQRDQQIKMGLPHFEVRTPVLKKDSSSISYIKIDTSKKELVYYDLHNRTLSRLSRELKPIDSLFIEGCIVNIAFQNNKWLACNVGMINPNNAKLGKAQWLVTNPAGKLEADTSNVLTNLARPVEIIPADLNSDGNTDYIVCEFGFITGSLSWYEQKKDGSFQRNVISPLPGATKVYVKDHNKDGLPDLWVLFAQGDEGVFLFTNQGKGQFQEEKLLRFPPSYGSTFFEMTDMNNDGLDDIVYTCGDNADYSPVMKPYHGVYVFLNEGKNHFKKTYFYPINGCYKALARDYDDDGDMDIATISFFADYAHQPEEGFLYFENTGNLTFQPFTFPEAKIGRWLTMDAGDLDGDYRIDLVLGNFSEGPPFLNSSFDWKKGPSFILLRNKNH